MAHYNACVLMKTDQSILREQMNILIKENKEVLISKLAEKHV